MQVLSHSYGVLSIVAAGLLLALAGCQEAVKPSAPLAVTPAVAAKGTGEDAEKASNDSSDTPAEKPDPATADGDPTAEKEKETGEEKVAEEPAPEFIQSEDPKHPFPKQLRAPEFPANMDWLNTKPIKLKDLKGRFVILDFWTYCCINCIHILPELKKLEQMYPDELVVIGVHSAKFDTEKDTDNIRDAILRYEIEHPVVNDSEHGIWRQFAVSSWPSIWIISPDGGLIARESGEFKAEDVDRFFKKVMPYYRENKLLAEQPIKFDLEAGKQPPTPLRFPGKVLADEAGKRLFIADSNHNRIVVAQLDGKLLEVIGSGKIGWEDGDFAAAAFNHPQGMALKGDKLYVADTENHLLRQVDLTTKKVKTVAGLGIQASHVWPGMEGVTTLEDVPEKFVGKPLETGLNSPWDLWIHDEGLYIAMAGPHQIWKMKLDESEIGPYAGNGAEDIVDGPLLPPVPRKRGFSSFAQPSGLSSDGEWLYVADSEGSSIRAVPFDPKLEVKTVIGSAHLPNGRLFDFGDEDGGPTVAKLQHALGVAWVDGKLYVADTYNNKLKVVDAKTGDTKTLAGLGREKPGKDDAAGSFDEPAGISHASGVLYIADTNNHLIRTYNLSTKEIGTLAIAGLSPPAAPKNTKPNFDKAAQVKVEAAKVQATDGQVMLKVQLALPTGFKINPLAPAAYWLEASGEIGPVDRSKLGRTALPKPLAEFEVPVPVTGDGADTVTVSLKYSYCSVEDAGICKYGGVVFTVPLTIAADGGSEPVLLKHKAAD